MKILVVCQYFYPEVFQINDICRELVRGGDEVTVLTGLPNYPFGTVPETYRHGKRRDEMWEGVRIIRCFETGRKRGTLWLGLNYISYCLSAAWKARALEKDFDVIFVYQLSPVLMAYPGTVMKKRSKKPLYLYCCDIWPESVKLVIPKESSLIFRIAKRISTALYQRCDMITVQSPAFFDYFETIHRISKERLRYIPQYADSQYLKQNFLLDNGVFDFVFLGNIGSAQGIDTIIEASKFLQQKFFFKIHIVGDGSFLEAAKALAREKNLSDYIEFYGRQPVEKMPEYYALADACLLTLTADAGFIGQTIPSKLQGYMAAGKMVIGAIDGPARDVIETSRCGLCTTAGDSAGLAEKMAAFMRDPEKYQDYGKNGRAYFVRHFSKEQYLKKTRTILRDLAEANHVSE